MPVLSETNVNPLDGLNDDSDVLPSHNAANGRDEAKLSLSAPSKPKNNNCSYL